MEETENFKQEVADLDPIDRRWLAAGGAIALAIVLFALLTGSVLGDAIAFVLAFAAGWIAHTEWQTISRRRLSGQAANRRRGSRRPTPVADVQGPDGS